MRMIEEAEKSGKIKPGWTLIEPTSGNTGIGLALASAVKGYRCIIVMPQKMSNEKSNIIRALGAEVVRTPSSASYDGPNSNFVVAQKLQTQIPNSYILDQFTNAGNPLAHYDCTAEELIAACSECPCQVDGQSCHCSANSCPELASCPCGQSCKCHSSDQTCGCPKDTKGAPNSSVDSSKTCACTKNGYSCDCHSTGNSCPCPTNGYQASSSTGGCPCPKGHVHLDAIVLGAGTGGTLSGLARKMKERVPHCKLIGADPMGSLLAPHKTESGYYEVEGIGYDFIPTVLDRDMVDEWVDTTDKDSFLLARDLIAKEGLLCGGSSGSALSAGLEVAKKLEQEWISNSEGDKRKRKPRIVVILPDGVRNYMTKFLDDKWMIERGFLSPQMLSVSSHRVEGTPVEEQPWFWNIKVSAIASSVGVVTVNDRTKCHEAISLMKSTNYDQLPVIDSNSSSKKLLGMVTVSGLMAKIASGAVSVDASVTNVLIENFPKISKNETLGALTSILKEAHYVVVIEDGHQGSPESRRSSGMGSRSSPTSADSSRRQSGIDTESSRSSGLDTLNARSEIVSKSPEKKRDILSGILTHIDVLNYLTMANSYEQ